MSVSLRFEGLDELKAALRQLPQELTGEASHIVQGVANGAIVDMRAEYAPGELRDGLYQSSLATGPFGVGIEIRNRSGWAWHWDHGTQTRMTHGGVTKKTGKSRKAHSTGAEWGPRAATSHRAPTPPKHTFGRNMAVGRRRMWTALKQLCERVGLTVTGEP